MSLPDEETDHFLPELSRYATRKEQSKLRTWLISALFFTNITWVVLAIISHWGADSQPQLYPPYSETRFLEAMHWDTSYSNVNKTLSNPLWKALFPSK